MRCYLSAAFNSSATDLRISRDNLSSFTARAIDTAPTSVDKAASAFLLRALGVLPETNLVSSGHPRVYWPPTIAGTMTHVGKQTDHT
jgi:excisionase family DNA binding protein